MWLYRNDTVFRGVTWNADQVFELVKLELPRLAQAKWPLEYGAILDTYRYPVEGAEVKKGRKPELWRSGANPTKGR